MKFGAIITIFSTLVAVVYGILFSVTYPAISVDGGLVTLCALLGNATCLTVAGLWKFVQGNNNPPRKRG